MHELDGLVETVQPVADARPEVDAERGVLGLEPGAADPEDGAPARQVVEGRDLLDDQRRVPERVGADHQPEGRALRDPRPSCEQRRTPRASARRRPDDGVEVVPRPQLVVAEAVGARAASRNDGQSVYWFQTRTPRRKGRRSIRGHGQPPDGEVPW